MWWVVASAMTMLYVMLFNEVANLYFDSERQLTLRDLYRRFIPPMDFHIQV
jgi:hypothetical protein